MESSTAESSQPESSPVGRIAAIAAIALAVLVVALLLLTTGGPYTVTAKFENASQLVGGEQVVVAGTPVGSVEDVALGSSNEAEVTFTVSDEYAPLRAGTQAKVTQFSLSGIANREIELEMPSDDRAGAEIPDDGVIEQSDTVSSVELDQLFNTLDDRTVQNLKKVIRGLDVSYDGVGKEANRGFLYLNPFLFTSRRLFTELSRDDRALERMLVDTSALTGALAERRDDVSALVGNLNRMMTAIGDRRDSLSAAIAELPGFMRSFNTTSVNLRAALDDVDPLVDASKPVARRLRPFFREFRGAARNLVPTIRDLDRTVRRRGRDNDLVDLTRLQPPLARIALGPVRRDGTRENPDSPRRRGAFPESTQALQDSLHQLEFLRAYTPELMGWFDDFSHSGIYDATGGIGRIGSSFNQFPVAEPNIPSVFQPPIDPAVVFGTLFDTGNTRRCPGSNERDPGDGSTPFTDNGTLNCDPSQVPVGP